MHLHPTPFILSLFTITACSPGGGAPRDPGSPTPVAGQGPNTGTMPEGQPGKREIEGPANRGVPVRADQAPLVSVRDALAADSLLGRRVRVAGRCTAAGEGRRANSWTLQAPDAAIEVRGRVPAPCSAESGTDLSIFAQIEPRAPGSRDRILLRLPD